MKKRIRLMLFALAAIVALALIVVAVNPAASLRLRSVLARATGRGKDFALQLAAADPDGDFDGDGLSNHQEVHKYFTDPLVADSDRDGVPDSDWNERREYAYSIRAVVKLAPPWDLAAMNDDYQDVRAISENGGCLTAEAIIYPLNTNAEAIGENPDWRADYAGMTKYLAPGVSTNWDEQMQSELLNDVKAAGIDPARISDKKLVENVAQWAIRTSVQAAGESAPPPNFFIEFPGGDPVVVEQLRWAFNYARNGDETDEQVFARDVLGRQMYEQKVHGTCASSATYLATLLRALGVPARIIMTVPTFDANDSAQVNMIVDGITNPTVRDLMIGSSHSGFADHFYNEVYVGGRWVPLNYDELGCNNLWESMGLLLHVDTCTDLAELPLATTWGRRFAGVNDPPLSSLNPYQLLEIADQYGVHSGLTPDAGSAQELTALYISAVYWQGDERLPVKVDLGNDRFVLGVEDEQKRQISRQLTVFAAKAGRVFTLTAPGRKEIRCEIDGTVSYSEKGFQAYILRLTNAFDLVRGVTYSIQPPASSEKFRWLVRDGVVVIRK